MRSRKGPALADMSNLIDQYIFGQMQSDGVTPAPASGDSEFLRRIYLDLTGRLPTVDQVLQFLNSTDAGKRPALIEQLLASDAYVDRWTQFYGDLFQVTSGYYQFISVQSRNRFNQYLREFVASDRPWSDVAPELITAAGDSYQTGPPNYIVRGLQQSEPIQDTWDTLTDNTTVAFLGLKTLCVSCHDGRGHLEQINLFLAPQQRVNFWQMSAFLARTDIIEEPADTYDRQLRSVITDRSTGGYTTWVDPNNPGPRPMRYGGPYSPVFMLTGDTPQGQYRSELARLVTSNRQFARAAANYLWAAMWAAMFTVGIVDPPGQWDIARIDPNNPPPAPWTLQPTNPALIEALATEFINSNYSIKHMIRLMANSQAYQLSSNYPGTYLPVYDQYFARHITRRLRAEEVYDAVAQSTMTIIPMELEGYTTSLYYAGQLPDVTEPRNDGTISLILNSFGRGDWFNNPRNSSSTIVQALFMMNDNSINYRTFTGKSTRVDYVLAQNMSDADAINNLFLSALSRYPTSDELNVIQQNRGIGTRDQWLTDLQWAILNKLDFLFNH
ncbi:conserved hypothetical protein [Candidatus Sulfopaludibacter sp. SbA3]|nr:conserved hypothetical protein [Candidatus Sulfopaludibacter sp. SbA3]